MKKLTRWYRRRRFVTAYKILRNEAERHTTAGHMMDFRAVNEADMMMRCIGCPNLLP